MAAPQSDVLRIEEIAVDDSEDLGSIAFVTIDRPDKLNALNVQDGQHQNFQPAALDKTFVLRYHVQDYFAFEYCLHTEDV